MYSTILSISLLSKVLCAMYKKSNPTVVPYANKVVNTFDVLAN